MVHKLTDHEPWSARWHVVGYPACRVSTDKTQLESQFSFANTCTVTILVVPFHAWFVKFCS